MQGFRNSCCLRCKIKRRATQQVECTAEVQTNHQPSDARRTCPALPAVVRAHGTMPNYFPDPMAVLGNPGYSLINRFLRAVCILRDPTQAFLYYEKEASAENNCQ